jgi:hypothetical protein
MCTCADSEDEALRASNSNDSESNECLSDDEYFIFSIIENPDPPDDDAGGADPSGTVAGAEMRLGELPGGGIHQTPGVFLKDPPTLMLWRGEQTSHALLTTPSQSQRVDQLHITLLKMGWQYLCL